MNKARLFFTLGAVVIAASLGVYFIVERSDFARLPEGADEGASPVLPPPTETLIPTVNIAPARGWPAGAKPTPTTGFEVTAYARGLAHPRWLYVLPNGDVLVAETDAPSRPHDSIGLRGMISRIVQRRAGADVQSANRI